MTKQSFLQLLANNEMDSLFEQLKSRQGQYSELVLLESQWNDLQSRQRSGTLSGEQANLEAARVRKSLLELIELSFSERLAQRAGNGHAAQPGQPASNKGQRFLLFGGSALLACLAFFLVFSLIKPSGETLDKAAKSENYPATPVQKTAKSRHLNTSAAEPMTFRPGDFQWERVYSVIEGKVESIGGGKSLVTLKVGMDFKGIINMVLSNDNFRLVAAELRGPLAPANFLSKVIDSKSYGEGEVKFEISDSITRFSVLLEGREDRKWDFSIE